VSPPSYNSSRPSRAPRRGAANTGCSGWGVQPRTGGVWRAQVTTRRSASGTRQTAASWKYSAVTTARRTVAFSPDGRRVASASGDATVRGVGRDQRSPIVVFRGHDGAVTAPAPPAVCSFFPWTAAYAWPTTSVADGIDHALAARSPIAGRRHRRH